MHYGIEVVHRNLIENVHVNVHVKHFIVYDYVDYNTGCANK